MTTEGLRLQRWRRHGQLAFFALFVAAPPLDLLRYDLRADHLVVLGRPWGLGLDAFTSGAIGGPEAALQLALRGLLPIVALAFGLGWVAWRHGRLYCGWLCPHYLAVETVNRLMTRAIGRPSLWERGVSGPLRPLRLIPMGATIVGLGAIWALTLLSYLIPPREIWSGLLHADLARGPALFLGVAWLVFSLEFLLARHLFCRFGCAVGLFQSIVWMANPRARRIAVLPGRAPACSGCDVACERECPMRLRPRAPRHRIFTCTQCGACVSACRESTAERGLRPVLDWQTPVRAAGRRPPSIARSVTSWKSG